MRTYTKLEQICIIETDLFQSYFISSLPGLRQFAGRFGDQGGRSSKSVYCRNTQVWEVSKLLKNSSVLHKFIPYIPAAPPV